MAEEDLIYPPGKNAVILPGGVMVPTGSRGFSPSEITNQIKEAVGLPYLGKEADKIGMTLLEAALYSAAKKAADGDVDALTKLLDRLMGKPVQQVVQATGTLKEFLDGIARSDPAIVEAEVVDPVDLL
jgi:hypothetical protein